MTRLLFLLAAGSVLALTSAAQAQLDDGVPSDSNLFETVIDLPDDPTPAFNVALGDTTGATLTQININAGSDVTTGRMYSFCEVNFFAPTEATSGSQNANYVNSEVNLINGNLGLGAMIGPNSNLNLTSGTISNGSTINGVANASGGRFNNFTTIGGTLNLTGDAILANTSTVASGGIINASDDAGVMGITLETGATLNLNGNAVLGPSNIAGVANLSGGSHAGFFDVEDGGVLNLMDDAELGTSELDIEAGGTINHSGGNLGFNTDVQTGGVLNISGGSFGASIGFADLDVEAGGTVNFTGSEFLLGGEPISGLAGGTTVIITTPDVLTGTLLDGSPVQFNLNPGGNDDFAFGSIVTVTLPLLGDVNLDGDVDFSDISPFITLLTTGAFQAEADINQSGIVDFSDIAPFISILSGASTP